MEERDENNLADGDSMEGAGEMPSLGSSEEGFLWVRSTRNDLAGRKVGEYEITGIIGEGGMGYVLKGIQPYIRKQVAIKVLKPDLTANEQSTNRFLAEAQAVNAIGHPNIIDIFSFGRFKEGYHYFVMEYLEGKTLGEYLTKVNIAPYREAVDILEDIFDALKAAHAKGIIHRDLKPDNIFLLRRKGRFFVKILDFGLAKISEEGIKTAHTKSGVPVGTPLYMSPEQCMGDQVDERADVYALGIILYRMFTGQVPFKEGSFLSIITAHLVQDPFPPSKLADMPPELEAIILKTLQKEREQRYQSMAQLEAALMPLLKSLAKEERVAHPTPIEGAVVPQVSPLDIRRLASQSSQSPVARMNPFKYAFFGLLILVIVAAGVAYFLGVFDRPAPGDTGPAELFPPAMAGGPARFVIQKPEPVMKKAVEKIFVNLLIEPSTVPVEIFVDGKKLKKRFFKVDKSEQHRLKVVVKAKGYPTQQKIIIPAFSQNLNFQLRRPAGIVRPMPGMTKEDLPDVL